jgi:hypothetical protein
MSIGRPLATEWAWGAAVSSYRTFKWLGDQVCERNARTVCSLVGSGQSKLNVGPGETE